MFSTKKNVDAWNVQVDCFESLGSNKQTQLQMRSGAKCHWSRCKVIFTQFRSFVRYFVTTRMNSFLCSQIRQITRPVLNHLQRQQHVAWRKMYELDARSRSGELAHVLECWRDRRKDAQVFRWPTNLFHDIFWFNTNVCDLFGERCAGRNSERQVKFFVNLHWLMWWISN